MQFPLSTVKKLALIMLKYLFIYKMSCIYLFLAFIMIPPQHRFISHPAPEAGAACQTEVSYFFAELPDIDNLHFILTGGKGIRYRPKT